MPIWNGAILWRGVTESEPFLTDAPCSWRATGTRSSSAIPSAPSIAGRANPTSWIAELRFEPQALASREDWNRPRCAFLPRFSPGSSTGSTSLLIRDASAIYPNFPLVDRDPVATWAFGPSRPAERRHPMYPIGSNGASQGILDAACITRLLQQHADSADAFIAYDAERRPKTSAIVLANRNNGPEQVMRMAEDRARRIRQHRRRHRPGRLNW